METQLASTWHGPLMQLNPSGHMHGAIRLQVLLMARAQQKRPPPSCERRGRGGPGTTAGG